MFFSLIVVQGMLIFIECKGKFAKLSYLIIITIVWLTGVGDIIDVPFEN